MKTKTKQNRLQLSRYAIYLVLVGMVLFFSIVAEGFFSASTFLNILRQVAVNGIVAVGMTMVIITGGIDISVGSADRRVVGVLRNDDDISEHPSASGGAGHTAVRHAGMAAQRLFCSIR